MAAKIEIKVVSFFTCDCGHETNAEVGLKFCANCGQRLFSGQKAEEIKEMFDICMNTLKSFDPSKVIV